MEAYHEGFLPNFESTSRAEEKISLSVQQNGNRAVYDIISVSRSKYFSRTAVPVDRNKKASALNVLDDEVIGPLQVSFKTK